MQGDGYCGTCDRYIGERRTCLPDCPHGHRLRRGQTPNEVQAARRRALTPPADIAPERLCEAPESLEGDVPTCILEAEHDGRHVVARVQQQRGRPTIIRLYRLDETGPVQVYETEVRWPVTRRSIASVVEFLPSGGPASLQR